MKLKRITISNLNANPKIWFLSILSVVGLTMGSYLYIKHRRRHQLQSSSTATIENGNGNGQEPHDEEDQSPHHHSHHHSHPPSHHPHHPHQQKRKRIEEITSISFGGAGWRMYYYMGVVKALNELRPDWYQHVTFAGASMGAWMSISAILGLNLDVVFTSMKQLAISKHNHSNLLDRLYIREEMDHFYNTHIKPNITPHILHKLAFSVTKIDKNYKMINKIKKSFKNEQQLYDYLISTAYVPMITGTSFLHKNKYCDGGLTNNNPLYDNDHKHTTLIVASFPTLSLHADIYPNCTNTIIPELSFSEIVVTIVNSLIPPQEPYIDTLFVQGYNDTMAYFFE